MHEQEEIDSQPGGRPTAFLADLAGPLKFISYFFFVLAALVLLGGGVNAIWYDKPFTLGTGIVLIVLLNIGWGIRKGATFLAAGGEPDFSKVVFWAFAGFGGALVLVGIVVAFDDPAGLFACLFGAVFIGVGFLARRITSTPKGKRAVVVSGEGEQVSATTMTGAHVSRTRTVSIYADENATDEQVEQIRARWATEQWMARPDWVRGELVTEADRNRTGKGAAAIVFLVLEAVMVTLAMIYGRFWWFMTFVVGVIAAMVVGAYLHDAWHRRKFAASMLVLNESPLRLGGEFRGELRSGVPVGARGPTGYSVTLQCVHRWERTTGTGNDRRKVLESQTLWKQEIEGEARAELGTHQCVDFAFTLPEDQPETSLGESREGNFWELHIHLPLPGLDYRAEFLLPVLSPQTHIDRSLVTG